VRLDTPEDIAAWIAERKRRWPTDARVAEKKRKLEHAMANGGLHPDHLALMGGKRFRPMSSDADMARTRGREEVDLPSDSAGAAVAVEVESRSRSRRIQSESRA